ncbi:MAG: ribonuclease PH [Alphaproteobacteria bacterium]|jgi:ribonuclease PH|nr:ribonuclease PH [Alphaproteobacteria bacterium]
MRLNNRANNQLRNLSIEINVNKHAEGSCLIAFGDTKVLCTASVSNKIPSFLKGTGSGWITAEYGMLPRSTSERMDRESVKGKQSGRTQEIQRLIGRSLRSIVDLEKLGEHQIKIDCDVIQADGGTRVASISGGFVAMYLAINTLLESGEITENPIVEELAAVSCGVLNGVSLLDLDYTEDSAVEVDSNFAITSSGKIIEMQVSSEKSPIDREKTNELLDLAYKGVAEIILEQKRVLNLK